MKYRVGIDLGGTFIKFGLVDEEYNILFHNNIPTKTERTPEEIMDDMATHAVKLYTEYGLKKTDIEGIGIGSPGTVDAGKGVVIYSNNFGWNDVNLADYISGKTGHEVRISNDANCATLGEVKAGAAKECRNCILITLGTGVGGGVVINGNIFEGGHAGGAELGHTMLIAGGEKCTCGRNGCLEAYASASALIRDTKRAALDNIHSGIWRICAGDHKRIDGKTVFDAAKTGDKTAIKVLENYISYLGDGIVDMVNIFRPDKVLISGGVCEQGDTLTVPLRAYVRNNCFASEASFIPEIEIAKLGNKAGIIGAASLFD